MEKPIVISSEWDGYSMYMVFMPSGSGHARLTIFDDGKAVMDTLVVLPEYRRKGLGTLLQLVREKIAKDKGVKYTYLFVEKRSWMRAWYSRRGYVYHGKFENDNKYVWLKKRL